jgi:argininosuccinate synthase
VNLSGKNTLVLAYSGRPGAGDAIRALGAATGAEIVTVTLDLGQAEDLEQVCLEARLAGAARTHVVDARDRFAADALLPALRAGVTGATTVRPTGLARPIIAAALAEVAHVEQASRVAHGAVGANGAAFARLLADHAPHLEVVTVDPAAATGDDTAPRISANLWGRTVVFPAPSDAWTPLPATLFTRTSDPTAGVTQAAHVDLTFESGIPVAVNGIPMSFLEVAEVVDTIAGDHGVGRLDQLNGGAREITEAPAAVTLATALSDLERARLDQRLAMLKMQLSTQYAALVDAGDWFSPARQALDAFIAKAASTVSGTVRVMLSRGACRVVGRELADASSRAMTSSSANIEPAL